MVPLLVQHPLLATTSPAQMEAALRDGFGAASFDVRSGSDRYRAAVNHWRFDREIGLAYCECDADVDIGFPEGDVLRVVLGLQGRAQYAAEKSDVRIDGQALSLVGPARGLLARYHTGCRQLVLRVDQARLRRHLETLLGRRVTTALTFDLESAGSLSPDSVVGNLLRLTAARLDDVDPPASALLMQELMHATLAALLTELPHSHSSLLVTTEKRLGKSQVDYAEAFMDAHWDKALTIERIAEELSCSVRSLFKSFQSQRGYSPMTFLRRRRLERAQSLLLNPRKDTSVLGVALLCGFSNAGHFARYYREQFGVLPSDTLRQGRTSARTRVKSE